MKTINQCEEFMTRTVRIKNCTSRTFFVRYTIDGEITTREISVGETEKFDIDKGDEELIHIKHCDRYGSLVRICESPVHSTTYRRRITPMFYANFDCVVDVKDYYAILEVNEHYFDLNSCLIPFFSVEEDTVKKQYFADEKDKRIIISFYTLLYFFAKCFFAIFVLVSFAAPFVDVEWSIGYSLFSFAFGIIPLIFFSKASKKLKKFKNCDMDYILASGNYISITSKTDKRINFEYILDSLDYEMRSWPFK